MSQHDESEMKNSKVVMLVVDNSKFSFTAFRWLAKLLLGDSETMTVLVTHVVKGVNETDLDAGRYLVQGFVELCGDKKIPCEELIVPCVADGIGATIVEQCEAKKPLVLVMGSRGLKNPFAQLIKSSVSAYCVWHVSVPVVIVPPAPQVKKGLMDKLRWEAIYAVPDAADQSVKIPVVVVAIDDTAVSHRAVEWICNTGFINAHFVDLVLIHVVELDEAFRGKNTQEETDGQEILDKALAICTRGGFTEHVKGRLVFTKKSVGSGIVDFVRDVDNCSLVVVAPRPYVNKVKRQLVSGTSQATLDRAKTPVLVFNDPENSQEQTFSEFAADDEKQSNAAAEEGKELGVSPLTSPALKPEQASKEPEELPLSSGFSKFTDFFADWHARRRRNSQ